MKVEPAANFFAGFLTKRHFVTLRYVVPVGALLGLVLLAWGLGQGEARTESKSADPPLPVETIRVERSAAYQVESRFTGMVEAARTSAIGFDQPGRVVDILVEEGDRVGKGDPLAQQESHRHEAKRREVAAQLEEGQSLLAELIAGPRKQQIEVAKAEITRLEAEYRLAEANHERNEQLSRGQIVSRQQFDQTDFGQKAAAARLKLAEAQLDELLEGTRKEQIAAQRARVATLSAQLESIEVDLSETRLVAPYDGIVLRRMVDEGDVVSAGQPVVQVIEYDDLEFRVGIPKRLADTLSADHTCQVKIMGRVHSARLKAKLPELDRQTRTQVLVYRLENKDGTALPNEIGEIVLHDARSEDGFWIPLEALTRGSRGLWSVYKVVTEEETPTLRQCEVEVLYTNDTQSYIRGTLSDGDQVVATGVQRIVGGQAVTPLAGPLDPLAQGSAR